MIHIPVGRNRKVGIGTQSGKGIGYGYGPLCNVDETIANSSIDDSCAIAFSRFFMVCYGISE